jgi:hypothetical protein
MMSRTEIGMLLLDLGDRISKGVPSQIDDWAALEMVDALASPLTTDDQLQAVYDGASPTARAEAGQLLAAQLNSSPLPDSAWSRVVLPLMGWGQR